MSFINVDQIKKLIEKEERPCISLYMPSYQAALGNQHDQICLKNLLKEAGAQLIARGLRPHETRQLLQPAHELIADNLFWQNTQKSLVIFLSPGFYQIYWMPFALKETVVVGDKFYLKPLLRILTRGDHYYLLTLSQNRIQLLKGDHDGLYEVELSDIPHSMQEALRFNEEQHQQQVHTGAASNRSSAAVFHGQGGSSETAKGNILEFFQQVDHAVCKYLHQSRAPLLTAGVSYIRAIYREANHYPYLLGDPISGNPEHWSVAQLHEKAWPIVKALFSRDQAISKELYKYYTNTARVSNDIRKIIPATVKGQVQILFVSEDEQAWGDYNRNTDQVHIHDIKKSDDQDLLDFAALQTLMHNGKVYPVAKEEVPDHGMMAAIFRY